MEFQIYDEGNEDAIQETTESKLESGDTASISDAIALLDEKIEPNEESSSSSDDDNHYLTSEGEDTANVSLFNDFFRDESSNQYPPNASKTKKAKVSSYELDTDGENGCNPVR